MSTTEDPARDFLRHTVATLAYRGGKAVRGAPPEFAAFAPGPSTRTPAQILAHVNDLLDWGVRPGEGPAHLQGVAGVRVGRWGCAFFRGVAAVRRDPRLGRAPRVSGGEAVSGPRRGRSHARRSDRAASASRRRARKGGKLLPGGHRRGPHGPRAGRPAQGVRVRDIVPAHATAAEAPVLCLRQSEREQT
jgi:hypothetical protein